MRKFLEDQIEFIEGDIIDLDETAFREGSLNSRLYGSCIVPQAPSLMQLTKTHMMYTDSEENNILGIIRYLNEEINPDILYILGIDSSFPDQDAGRIGKRSIERIGEKLKQKIDKIKILCFYHHLLPIPLTGRERSTIIDGGDMLEMILDSDVDIVINGHRHISNIFSFTN